MYENRPMHYGWDGKPISMEEWAHLFEEGDRHVALTDLGPLGSVSTVWLGLDHNFSPSGPPLIFESMVFGGPMDQEQVRYATAADALMGHNFLVTWLTSVLDRPAKGKRLIHKGRKP